MQVLIALCCGTLFGAGLLVSQMTNPAKVLAFLDVFGDFDPALAFVMLGALSVTIPVFALARRMQKPALAAAFSWPTKTDLDLPLISGAVLFGCGWGLVGWCPGPALAVLFSGRWEAWLFLAALITGSLLGRWARPRMHTASLRAS